MTPDDFRSAALALPEAVESSHHGHPDFRVGGKVFATLGYPDDSFAVVMLSPDDQAVLVKTQDGAFEPVPGGWGRSGSTRIILARADPAAVRDALETAWRRKAPKRLRGGS